MDNNSEYGLKKIEKLWPKDTIDNTKLAVMTNEDI